MEMTSTHTREMDLAIGLGDGTVLLYRHLEQYLTNGSGINGPLPKVKTILDGTTAEPITGLGFREPPTDHSHADGFIHDEDSPDPNIYLYIITTSRVLSVPVSGSARSSEPKTVDEVGASLQCSATHKGDIVVAREEAIFVVGVDGRKGCYAYEGEIPAIEGVKFIYTSI